MKRCFLSPVLRVQFLFCSIRVVPLTFRFASPLATLYHPLGASSPAASTPTQAAGFEFGTLRERHKRYMKNSCAVYEEWLRHRRRTAALYMKNGCAIGEEQLRCM